MSIAHSSGEVILHNALGLIAQSHKNIAQSHVQQVSVCEEIKGKNKSAKA